MPLPGVLPLRSEPVDELLLMLWKMLAARLRQPVGGDCAWGEVLLDVVTAEVADEVVAAVSMRGLYWTTGTLSVERWRSKGLVNCVKGLFGEVGDGIVLVVDW